MPPSVDDRLNDITNMVAKINHLTKGMTEANFAADETIRAAVERYLGIACEASLRLPAELKQNRSDIDWRAMNDFANVLRHGYHAVNVTQVWKIVQVDLPMLREFAEKARGDREQH